MRISVIIPCHNAGRWIVAALRSVSQQTHPAHEVIVIDDGSTDDSLAQIGKSGVSVRLTRVNVRNAGAARNAGIEAATGDWVALLDADDVWYPNHLARAAELLDGTKDVAFMSNHDWIDLEGRVIPIPDGYLCKLPAPRRGLSLDDYFRIGKDGFHFGHSTVLYRRNRLAEVGLFDVSQRHRHDIDLWLRVIVGRTWAYDTVKGVGYREATPGSISKNELECDYYYLRSLVRNLDRADSPLYREHLARQARRAMGVAFVLGADGHCARIRELAWPHLPWLFRSCYAVGSAFPGPLRWLIKTKRRLTHGAANMPPAPSGES